MTPTNVLAGCKPALVIVARGAGTPAFPHRGMDGRILKKLQSDAKRYPHGHRNLTKAQRRVWGLIGKPGRPARGISIFAPGTFEEAPK
jgi:hypothetical protein